VHAADAPPPALWSDTMSSIHREYHKWYSPHLNRPMELLIFGSCGGGSSTFVPAIVFPTAHGRFYEFEDNGMVQALASKLHRCEIQLFCVDHLEAWADDALGGQEKIEQQLRYERYILDEVLPLIHNAKQQPHLAAIGCGFGGYQAANIALRHPERFNSFLAIGTDFDVSWRLNGYMDENAYLNLPTYYMPNLNDSRYLDRYRHSTYILATGDLDPCKDANERMAGILRAKHIPCRLDIWGNSSGHDWPCWQKMLQHYL
jgi:esterase/lipase superfamily enzyme